MFAEKDSLRAYLPLAKICLNANDTVGARKYAQLLFNQQADSELAKEILAKIEEMKQQKEDGQKVDQEAPVTQQPTQANPDNDQSKEEAAKKQEEERKKQEAERKKQEAKKAAEEQLETALRNQDWKTLERLANQGNTRASDALAEHYVNAVDNLENNQQAEKWANKASTTVRRKVRHILYLRGYLTEDN
jgi:colicin import membrane protein